MSTETRNQKAEQAAANREGRRRGLITLRELLSRPDPEWMVEGMIPEGGNFVVFGQPGTAKSFLLQGLSMALIHDTDWHGVPVKGGPVVYIAAEGAAGLKKRLRVWMEDHGGEARHEFHCFPEAVNFLDSSEVRDLVEELRALPESPVLVVVDTLSRCMAGGDENHPKDMTRYVDSCDMIYRATGAAVGTIHHTTKDGDDYRGHSSLRGAADTMIRMKKSKDMVNVHCYKQKDAEEFADLTLALIPVGDSCVLGAPGPAMGKLTRVQRSVLEAVAASPTGMQSGEIGKATKLRPTTLRNAVNFLCESGFFRPEGSKKNSPNARYLVTPTGRLFLDMENSADSATTPQRGVCGVVKAAPTPQNEECGVRCNIPLLKPNSADSATTPQPESCGAVGTKTGYSADSATTPQPLQDTTANYSATSSPLKGEGGAESGSLVYEVQALFKVLDA